jgi:hypothetical protein
MNQTQYKIICVKYYGTDYFLDTDLEMATPASNTPSTQAPTTQSAQPSNQNEILPSAATLLQAAKLAITEDKEIKLDYFRQTANGTAFLGEDPESKERVLVKSKEEFTSLVKKLYKVGDDFIILTENSLYIVSGKIQKRKINLASLQGAYEE